MKVRWERMGGDVCCMISDDGRDHGLVAFVFLSALEFGDGF